MKRLILLRHAKSDWSQGGITDFERPLNKRGVNSASNMGKWMAHNVELPNVILCSSARRTQQTLQLLLLAIQLEGQDTSNIKQKHLDALYLASFNTINQQLKSNFNSHDSVMIVGHNPGMDSMLMHYGPHASRTLSGQLMTTANIAVIEFDDLFNPELILLQRPREL